MIFALGRAKDQVSTMFLRDRPCDLARMFHDPLPILLRMAANLQPLNTRRRRRELQTVSYGFRKAQLRF